MATSALQGQSALFTLPPAPIVGQEDYEETITSYHLPVQLELKEKTSEKSPLGNGMSVYKVSKVSLHLNICLKVTFFKNGSNTQFGRLERDNNVE